MMKMERLPGLKSASEESVEKRAAAPWTIGAGGYQCPVARKIVKELANEELVDRMHYSGGYREYWTV